MTEKSVILAVDDTSESLALLVKILTPQCYAVRAADSGELALAAVATNPPDLILLDIRMKGVDGFEVCRRLKAREQTRHIPIILMSAFAEVHEWVQGLQLGAADYISKPFLAEELLARVKTHLALSHSNLSLAQQATALRHTNEQLQSEMLERQSVEEQLRRSLAVADRALKEQKQAEAARRESEARNQALLGAIPDLIFLNRRDGEYLSAHCSDPGKLFVPPEKFLQRKVAEVLPVHVADQFMQAFAEAIDTGALQERTYTLPINGLECYFEARVMPSMEDRVITIVRDITERKRAEQELDSHRHHLEELVQQRTNALTSALDTIKGSEETLRRAHEEQRAIFESVTVGVALISRRVIVRCNRALEEIFGYTPGEMLSQTMRICFPDETNVEEVGRNLLKQIAKHGIYREERRLARKDGSQFWGRLSARPLERLNPELGLVGVIEDITAERNAAQALCTAKEIAEDATRMKSNFLANMSHEIRTPMNALIGLSHLLLKTELTPRQQDYTKKIQLSSQHLLGLVNDILDFSKIEAGRLKVEQAEFGLEKVLENIAALMQEKTKAKGLDLLFDVDPEVPDNLVGDPIRLGQILINYANNAVKFTEHGEIALQVRLADESEGDVLLHCSVRDTGIGLSEDQRCSLFQSFQQADGSNTRKYGGSGLGLAISKSLAEMMGGEVGVESEVGKGSTFWFTARLGKCDKNKHLPEPALRARKVLVVDDNDVGREVLCNLLRSMSALTYDVASSQTAVEAVRRAVQDDAPYEVIVVDGMTPERSGLDAARQIVNLSISPFPDLVLVTAIDGEDIKLEATRDGIEDVLIKSVSVSTLLDTLSRILAAQEVSTRRAPLAALPTSVTPLAAIRGARILLVEDDPLNQEVACGLLEDAGMLVDVAEDGAVALHKVQQTDYDIVLMDIHVPVMDGLSATREIRKLPQCRDLPIVALAANVLQADSERCLEAGMNDHISKPIDPGDLWLKLLKWVKPPEAAATDKLKQSTQRSRKLKIPKGIYGLDTAQGLKRVLGNHSIYLSLLRKFAVGQKHTMQEISTALDADDVKTAERLAHSLKGVAGSLGAIRLQQESAAVESAIRQRQPRKAVNASLEPMATSLGALIASLERQLPKEVAAPARPPGDVEQKSLHRACADLVRLLAEGNFEAGHLLETNKALLQKAFGDSYAEIYRAVHDFDHDLAMLRLREASALRGINL